MKKKSEIIALCKKHGVEHNLTKRWEKGTPHHPLADKMCKMLDVINFTIGDDSLGLKFGGDGDNGEDLLYNLDVVLELMDKGVNAL